VTVASPTELARQALDELKGLHAFVSALDKQIAQYDILAALSRLAILDEKLTQLAKQGENSNRVPVIDDRVAKLETRAAEADSLREQVAVLKAEMVEMKRAKEQTDNRVWNVLMIAVGAVLSLLGGVVVQLIAFAIKK
jgi:hypothetical protein